MTFQIKLEDFEGTVNELLVKVKKRKVDITSISLSAVTGQYLEYLKRREDFDLEQAGNFLVSASRLLALKASLLVPGTIFPEEEADVSAGEELAKHLLEYRTFKEAADFFKSRIESQERVYIRDVDISSYIQSIGVSTSLEGLKLEDLLQALEEVLTRSSIEDGPDVVEVVSHELSVADKMTEIETYLEQVGQGVKFDALFSQQSGKQEIIVTFLALLELVRQKKVRIKQEGTFGPIVIYFSPEP